VVNGAEERHTEGAYYLEWREGTKRVRVSLGKDAQDATARRLRKEAELNANNHGVSVTPTPSKNGHRQLSVAISEWLAEIKLTKKPKTLAAYTNGLEYFAESCTKQFVEDVERRDLLAFTAYLRDKKSWHHKRATTASATLCPPEVVQHSWSCTEERPAAVRGRRT